MKAFLALALSVCPFAAAADCPPLNDDARAKLIQYVQQKYKLPATMPLAVAESGALPDSCFHRLAFSSQDQRRPYQLELVASPDFRFLTKDILDIRVDPLEEERAKQKALVADLARPGGAILGPKEAPVTINVFSDFQCPYCAQMANGLIKDILPLEGDRVRLVFRNFPLAMHPWARQAAEAAECARRQGDKFFWSFHDYLFDNQREVTPVNLKDKLAGFSAGLAGFDPSQFTACVDRHQAAAKVDEDLAMGRRLGITGTPTIFVNTDRITGYRPEPLKALIRQLSGNSAQPDSQGNGEGQKIQGQACNGSKCEPR